MLTEESSSAVSIDETIIVPQVSDELLRLNLRESIKRSLIGKQLEPSSQTKSKKTFEELIDRVLGNPARVVKTDGESKSAITLFIPTESPSSLVNVVLQVESEEVLSGYINEFQMSPDFAAKFNSFQTDIYEFQGELVVWPLEKLFDLLYQPEAKNLDGSCFTILFDLRPSAPTTGGGDGSGNDEGNPNSTTGDPSGSPINWGISTVYHSGLVGPVSSGSDDSNTGGSGGGTDDTSTNTGTSGGDGGVGCAVGASSYVVTERIRLGDVYVREEKTYNCDHTLRGTRRLPDELLSTFRITEKSLDTEECIKLLASVGVVPRSLSFHEMSDQTREKIEATIAKTCFDNAAVFSIIDPQEFEDCYVGGDSPSDVNCITDQVVAYLNGLNLGSGTIPGTPISTGSLTFDDLPHDQLAAFLHAAVAGNGNEHVLRAMAFIRTKLTNELVTNNLAEILLQAAILHVNDPDNFTGNAAAYINIINKTNGELTTDDAIALVTNSEVLIPVSNFLDEVGYSEFALNTIKLHAAELRNGLIADEVGSERWNNTIVQNESFFSSALDLEDLPDCCGTEDVYIPVGLLTVGTATQTAGEFAAWHEVRFEEEAALLKYVYPEKYPLDTRLNRLRLKLDVEYRVMSSSLHATLDLLGLIPGVGAAPDLINGVWYTVEGDGLGATLSFSAAIPVVGLLAAGSRIVKWVKFGASGKRRLSWLRHSSTNEIFFYPFKVKSWRKFWHFPEGKVGHHMIPKAQSGHPLLQKAAKVTDPDVAPFHPHDLPNGYALDPARHIGSHPVYTQKIVDEMNRWNDLNPNVSPEAAAVAIRSWQTRLTARLSSTTGSIDNITIPRIPNP